MALKNASDHGMEHIIVNTSRAPKSDLPEKRHKVTDAELEQIIHSLDGLRYGAVQIIVQDGVIVQIDRTEKRRLRNGRGTV